MPTGPPDSHLSPPERNETTVDRIIRESMDAGDFENLPGRGKPLPGAGTVDDEMWWVRSWLKRNRDPSAQESSSSA